MPLQATWATIAAPMLVAAAVRELTLLFATERGLNLNGTHIGQIRFVQKNEVDQNFFVAFPEKIDHRILTIEKNYCDSSKFKNVNVFKLLY